jgi:hypothetical protein
MRSLDTKLNRNNGPTESQRLAFSVYPLGLGLLANFSLWDFSSSWTWCSTWRNPPFVDISNFAVNRNVVVNSKILDREQ